MNRVQLQAQCTDQSIGLVKKMRFTGGKLSLERGLMHFGCTLWDRSKAHPTKRPEAEYFLQWARQQPWLRVEDAVDIQNGVERPTFRLVLVEAKLSELEVAA